MRLERRNAGRPNRGGVPPVARKGLRLRLFLVLGLLFTAWSFRPLDILSVTLALVSGGLLYALLLLRGKPVPAQFLLVGGVFYAAFMVAALVSIL